MSSVLRLRNRLPTVPRWAIGLAIATPVAAVVQGSVLLSEYRQHHGDAPHPVSPSRGIVVMKVGGGGGGGGVGKKEQWKDPPIRLLVIGDSLAAGVGVSKRGTPILPESIARALSQASGGRAVSWTCVGTPGASAGRIVQDILRLKKTNGPNLLEKQLVEWQATKQRAQEWLEQRKKLKRVSHDQEKLAANRIQLWWKRLRHDVRDFRDSVLRRGDHKQAVISQLLEERQLAKKEQTTGVDTAEFDIAIVLTGLNDLKDAYLPFMMGSEDKDESADEGIKGGLLRVIEALRNRMKISLPVDTNPKDEASEQQQRRKPMVVFPAIPGEPFPLFHRAPLSWFLVPLLQALDHQKKLIAEQFPDLVLFVDSPSYEDIRDVEAGRGPLTASRRAEKVLLATTDVTQRAKEKVEKLMKQHYQRWTTDAEEDRADDEPRDAFENACHDHLPASEHKVGSSLVAADNVHPNDDGYDFWGRYIAAAIISELNRKDQWNLLARNQG